jgi:hypothetical protein
MLKAIRFSDLILSFDLAGLVFIDACLAPHDDAAAAEEPIAFASAHIETEHSVRAGAHGSSGMPPSGERLAQRGRKSSDHPKADRIPQGPR